MRSLSESQSTEVSNKPANALTVMRAEDKSYDEKEWLPRTSSTSDVEVFEAQAPALVHDMPHTTINVTGSTNVNVKPRVVTVNQTIQNNEVIKGRLLCVELVSPHAPRRLRCSVAICVCWPLVLATSLSVYLFLVLYNHNTRIDLDLKEDWYLRRSDWQALPPYAVHFLNTPVEQVVVGHSVTTYCNETVQCKRVVRSIQQDHLDRRMEDIGPNFLVSGNGLVLEGRGANIIGAMLIGWNSKSIGIMFIGDYTKDPTTQAQFDHVNQLLNELVRINILRSDYRLQGFCQLETYTISPGRNIMKNMGQFANWVETNKNKCLPG